MSDTHALIDAARAHFETGRRAATAGRQSDAAAAFREAAGTAAQVWREESADAESRGLSARLSADASWLAGTHASGSEDASTMRGAVLIGVEIFERASLDADVRLHGLYRAQCAAFELGHALGEKTPVEAEALFEDAVRCAEALDAIQGAEAEKVARVLANASAASHALAALVRQRGDKSFKDHLEKALEIGERAAQMPELRGPLQAEVFMVLGEISYELSMTIEDASKAVEVLRSAIGWSREASEAPGADGLLQAQALQKGANYACVYGLYRRHEDFAEGVSALEGAVVLALSVADQDHLPMALRAESYDTAIRTRQNIALLLKERDRVAARDHFGASDTLARRAASVVGISERRRGEFLYLAANATLEQGILSQAIAGELADGDALRFLRAARDKARAVIVGGGASPQVVARAALIVCGVSGRLLQTFDGDADALVKAELETIEAFGQRAAQTEGASSEHRSTGAAFAADAAERLAERTEAPRERDELRHRAEALRKLQAVLESG